MLTSRFLACRLLALALAASLGAGVAWAAKADRSQPITVEADQPGSVDLQRQVVVFNGNVVVTQGTMVLHADRVELREQPDGWRSATAFGSASRPATFREKRDGVDETVEGQADRIEYDGRTDTLRLVGHAEVRRLRGTTLADQITGSLITWDNTRELFNVSGGTPSPTNPTGRVRAVFTPAPEPEAAASAASAAPASTPTAAGSASSAAGPAAAAPASRPRPRHTGAAIDHPGQGEPILKPSPTLEVPR